MHRFRTVKEATGFLISSICLCLSFVLLLAGIGSFIGAFVTGDARWQMVGLWFAGFALICWLAYRVVAGGYNCPLCMNPLLLRKICNRNHRAKTFFKSYRMRIAIAAIFKGEIRCSYCGEVTRCEGRQKGVASTKTEKRRRG